MGFASLALGAILFEDGVAHALPPGEVAAPATSAKARSVIWLFMIGGVSHLETFDPKSALTTYHGKTIAETPHTQILQSPQLTRNARTFAREPHLGTRILRTQVGFRKRGASGLEVSDWLPQVGECSGELAVVRSLWTTDFSHSAQLEFHTGRTSLLNGREPALGSWVHYGLGTLNSQLPQFVVLGRPPSDFGGGSASHQASYLGPEHDGVPLTTNTGPVLPYPPQGAGLSSEAQRSEFELVGELNRLVPDQATDSALQARIKSYELAFRMQSSLPGIVNWNQESKETHTLYGLDDPVSRPFGQMCLSARRLVEQGVRFVQIYHGGSADDDNGLWDSHQNLRKNHSQRCAEIDRPIAGLLKDLRRRGLLDSTLVVWASEFGRSPNVEPRPDGEDVSDAERGRDHHIYGFSGWLAGGGIKGGVVHGSTDELGFHAVENRHYVTDIHATVLHLLGLDMRRLEIPGRKRLDLERGRVISEILA
jgi:hypothetical protein